MGKIIVSTFVSLDGVMQSPGMPDEDRDGGFDHGGWQVPHFDEKYLQIMTEEIDSVEVLLLGRRTYDIFADYWPKASADDPIGAVLNRIPKYVASRTLDTVGWQNSTLLANPIEDRLAQLKRVHRTIHVIGSGNLVRTLLAADLVDEFATWIFPVLIGSGKRLFEPGLPPATLRLTESVTTPAGAVLLRYRRMGPLTYGTAAHQPDVG